MPPPPSTLSYYRMLCCGGTYRATAAGEEEVREVGLNLTGWLYFSIYLPISLYQSSSEPPTTTTITALTVNEQTKQSTPTTAQRHSSTSHPENSSCWWWFGGVDGGLSIPLKGFKIELAHPSPCSPILCLYSLPQSGNWCWLLMLNEEDWEEYILHDSLAKKTVDSLSRQLPSPLTNITTLSKTNASLKNHPMWWDPSFWRFNSTREPTIVLSRGTTRQSSLDLKNLLSFQPLNNCIQRLDC